MDKTISTEELSELQQYNIVREQLQSRLGLIVRQRKSLDAEEVNIFEQFNGIDREEQMVINRLKKKYEMPEGARIMLDTGAIVE